MMIFVAMVNVEVIDMNVYKINFSGYALVESESEEEAIELFSNNEYEFMSANIDGIELTEYKG